MRRFERHRRDERPRLEAMIRRFLDCADAANPCSDSRHQAMPAAGRRISSTACRLSRFGSRAAVGPRSCPGTSFRDRNRDPSRRLPRSLASRSRTFGRAALARLDLGAQFFRGAQDNRRTDYSSHRGAPSAHNALRRRGGTRPLDQFVLARWHKGVKPSELCRRLVTAREAVHVGIRRG